MGKFLSSLYRDETITAIIEEAINGIYQLTFIIRDTGQERALSRGDLSAIRNIGKKAEIEIVAPSSEMIGHVRRPVSFGRRQTVSYSDLRANEVALGQIKNTFGNGDKGTTLGNLEFHIAPLTSKEIEERKREIMIQSLDQRSDAIKLRGFKIYAELKQKYPKVKFDKKDVAQFIQDEEKSIHELLKKELPHVASYLKHTRKPNKSIERSMS